MDWIEAGVPENAPLGMTVTSRGHVIMLDGRSAAEFDAGGEFLARVPRFLQGSTAGPYETVAGVGSDSLILADNRAGVLRIIGRARTQSDSVRLPGNATIRALRVLDWPRRILISGHAVRRDGLFMARVDAGFLVIDTTFNPPDAPPAVRTPNYRFSHGNTGSIWAVESHSYTMLEFGPDGSLLNRAERSPSWFGKPERGRSGGLLRSTVKAVWVDEMDRLWVYSRRPTSRAVAAWRSPETWRPGGAIDGGLDELYETVVEVLEPDGRALVTAGTIPGHLVGLAADGRAFFHQRNRGRPGISVQRLRLVEGDSP